MMMIVMARQTTVTVTDDLNGSANAKDVTFGWDGTWWTIVLSAKNRANLEKALKPYLAVDPGWDNTFLINSCTFAIEYHDATKWFRRS